MHSAHQNSGNCFSPANASKKLVFGRNSVISLFVCVQITYKYGASFLVRSIRLPTKSDLQVFSGRGWLQKTVFFSKFLPFSTDMVSSAEKEVHLSYAMPNICSNKKTHEVDGNYPPTSKSDHQDSYLFSRESQPKPSFVTGILGGG